MRSLRRAAAVRVGQLPTVDSGRPLRSYRRCCCCCAAETLCVLPTPKEGVLQHPRRIGQWAPHSPSPLAASVLMLWCSAARTNPVEMSAYFVRVFVRFACFLPGTFPAVPFHRFIAVVSELSDMSLSFRNGPTASAREPPASQQSVPGPGRHDYRQTEPCIVEESRNSRAYLCRSLTSSQ